MNFGRLVMAIISSFFVMFIIGIVVFLLLKRLSLSGKGKSTVKESLEAKGSMQMCSACGASNPRENHFCDKCGAELGG
mgnify:CR=1 FL=1|jgi:ribosomal protein L40E